MAQKKGPIDKAKGDVSEELIKAAVVIAGIVIWKAVEKVPDAIDWAVKNAPPAAKTTGRAGVKAAKAVARGAASAGKTATDRWNSRRSGRQDGDDEGAVL